MLAHSPVLRRHFAPLRTREAGIPGGILPHPDIPFFGQKREILDREAQRPGGPGTARRPRPGAKKVTDLFFGPIFRTRNEGSKSPYTRINKSVEDKTIPAGKIHAGT